MTRPVESTRSIAIVASVLALAMMGTTLPTPLYPIYVRTFGLASVLVPVIFATYAAGVIAALLFLGYLSDEIGRRRMIVPALLLSAASAIVFLFAQGLALLLVGRFLSGLSAGIASGAATAWIVDLGGKGSAAEKRSTRVAASANFAGLAAGPLVAGLLARYAPAPLRSAYAVDLSLLLIALAVIGRARETVIVERWHLRLRVQKLAIEKKVRSLFVRAAIAGFCAFAVAGVINAVAPSFLGKELHDMSPAMAGALVALFFASGIAGQLALSVIKDRAGIAAGGGALIAGLVCLAGSLVWRSSALLFAAAAAAGLGQGLAVGGGLSELNAKLGDKRGETNSTYFVLLYTGVSLPVVGVGFVASASSLVTAGLIFCAIVAATVIVALLSMVFSSNDDAETSSA